MDVLSGGHGVNGQPDVGVATATLDPELIAARIALRVAQLGVLAATTAVVWGRSPGKPFEQIAGEALARARRFHDRLM